MRAASDRKDSTEVARVLGIGGVFFKSEDPDKLQGWYRQHMGLPTNRDGYTLFTWRDNENSDREHATVSSPFPHDTDYFNPTKSEYMINYIVDDLNGMLAQLREAGAQVDGKVGGVRVRPLWLGRRP
jgi:hypothetical protein